MSLLLHFFEVAVFLIGGIVAFRQGVEFMMMSERDRIPVVVARIGGWLGIIFGAGFVFIQALKPIVG